MNREDFISNYVRIMFVCLLTDGEETDSHPLSKSTMYNLHDQI